MKVKKAVTLSDIGRAVGVSTMTVSAVVNGTRSNVRVSDGTRIKIKEAASELGYRPNAVGRGLIKRRMSVIGVMAEFNDIGGFNTVLHQLLDGILEGCIEYGQCTTIYPLRRWSDDGLKILNSCNGLVDGFILIGPSLSEDVAAKLYEATPFVAIHNSGSLNSAQNIEVDNVAGAYAITSHLIKMGHTRIAHVAGAQFRSGSHERLTGYRMALADAKIDFDPNLVIAGRYTYSCGTQAAQDLLRVYGKKNLPSAIFCANDAMACGVIDGLMSEGVAIPLDVSVAGFDDSPVTSLTGIKPATVKQPLHSMGIFAVSQVLSKIDEQLGLNNIAEPINAISSAHDLAADVAKVKWTNNTVLFEPSLIIRNSVAPYHQPVEDISRIPDSELSAV